MGLRQAEPGEQRGLPALPLHTVLCHREWKTGLQDLAGNIMTILLADIAVFPSRSDFFFPTPFLVENICLLLKFLRCSRGRLCRWMLSSQPLSMRSNRSLSMCGARQAISTVLPFGWNQLLDSLSEGGHVRRGRGREHLQRQFFHRGRW